MIAFILFYNLFINILFIQVTYKYFTFTRSFFIFGYEKKNGIKENEDRHHQLFTYSS